MDFTISPRVEDYRARIAAFVDAHILPLEADPAAYDGHGNIGLAELARLRGLAREQGLWCLQLKPETGGAGLDKVGMAVCYEAMNRSIFGPVVFNSAAPDDGNMMVLERVATPRPEGALARSDRARRGPLGLRHDRAASRRRLRSRDDPDPGRAARRHLRGHGPQVVHHRRRGGRALHPDGADLRRPAQGPDRLPVPQGPARLGDPAPHPDHGARGARRPLRAAVRRPGDPGRERPDARGRRPEADADPPRARRG